MTHESPQSFLGWYGFGIEHPASWELNRIRGNRRSAYLCLDDGEHVRLELSWKPVPRKASLDDVRDGQVKALEKAARRRRVELDVDAGVSMGKPRGFEYRQFAWTGDLGACEMIARCKDCGRVILVRVTGVDREPPVEEARGVFRSLECYSGKDRERWGAFGLDVAVPSRFELEGSSLKTGVTQLTFSDRRVELCVTRVSMGRRILERQKMVDWYHDFAQKVSKTFEVKWRDAEFRGHLGYEGSGEPWARGLWKLFRTPRRVAVRAFYCDVTDKIFTLSADGPRYAAESVEEVLEGVKCH